MYVPADLLDGRRSRAVRGVLDPQRALDLLLADSGLEGDVRGGVLHLRATAPVRVRPQPRVAEAVIEAEGSEEIVVVGTNLRGHIPASAPVEIYTSDDIRRSGAFRTEDFVQTLTQNLGTRTQYGPGATAAVNREGVNGIDLRGLGAGTTLVLLDGRRLPLASDGRVADLSFLPLQAIDRVEVLTDGASAIYGSDAIGGVVNFVLRRGVSGEETRGEAALADGFEAGALSHATGRRWLDGDALVVLEWRAADALRRADRSFSAGAGEGDLSPADARVNLVGRFSQRFDRRVALRSVAALGWRDVASAYEIPEAQAEIENQTEAVNWMAGLGLDADLPGRLVASLDFTMSGHESDARTRVDRAAGVSVLQDLSSAFWHQELTAKLQGEAWRLPGGPLRYSVGAGEMRERFSSRQSDSGLGRDTRFAFFELAAPVFREGEGLSWLQALELSAAVRVTDYHETSRPATHEFGAQTSPRLGLFVAPNPWLGFRASYSWSYRAPALADLDPVGSASQLIRLNVAGEPSVVLALFGPSDLIAETAETLSLGFEASVPFLSGLQVRASYFEVDYHDRAAIGDASNGFEALSHPEVYPDIVYTPRSAAIVADLLRASPVVLDSIGVDLRDADSAAASLLSEGRFFVFDNRLRNLTRVALRGVDMSATFVRTEVWGDWRIGGQLTYMANYREQITANAPIVDVAGTVLRPARLRARLWAGFDWEALDIDVAATFVDGLRNPFGAGDEQEQAWTSIDVMFGLDVDALLGGTDNDGLALRFGIRNLLDAEPPYVSSSGVQGAALRSSIGFDPANVSPIGRAISIELSKRW